MGLSLFFSGGRGRYAQDQGWGVTITSTKKTNEGLDQMEAKNQMQIAQEYHLLQGLMIHLTFQAKFYWWDRE